MAETLGSLCDKLSIVKLKQWHSAEKTRLESLAMNERHLVDEINEFVENAVEGRIPQHKLTFAANKVYKAEGNHIEKVSGTIGQVMAQLSIVNCMLWHEQEKVYEFELVPAEKKDEVVKKLALLNLERNQCIDEIDRQFSAMILSNYS
jgi:hypothetical protein